MDPEADTLRLQAPTRTDPATLIDPLGVMSEKERADALKAQLEYDQTNVLKAAQEEAAKAELTNPLQAQQGELEKLKTVTHLDEHLVDIGTKGITKPKEVRKFKGEGMPLHFSNKKGDLYVTFEVLFPTSLTDEQKTKLKAILG